MEQLIGRTTNANVRRFAKIALEGSIAYHQRNAVMVDESLDELEG